MMGKKVVRESLGERDPKAARRKAADRNLHWEREFERAEAKLKAAMKAQPFRTDLTDAEVDAVVADYRRYLLWSDEQIRLHGLSGKDTGLSDEQYNLLSEVYEDITKITAEEIARGQALAPPNIELINAHLHPKGIALDPGSKTFQRVAIGFVHARSECFKLWQDRHAGKVVETPPARTLDLAGTPEALASELSFQDMIDGWKLERRPKQKTADTFTQKLRLFERSLGEGRGIATATAKDANAWKAARLAEGQTPKTVQNDLYAAKAVFGWAAENLRLASDPFAGVRLTTKGRAKKSNRRPYSDDEAVRILRATRAEKKPAKRWIPWLDACLGVRVSEAAQINRDDFECHGQIWLLRVTELMDDDEDEQDQYPVKPNSNGEIRSTKNENSERILPIPSILINEGFIEFVKGVKRGQPIFADVEPDMYGSRGGNASKQIRRFVRVKVGIKDRRIAPNHSFRHWFKDVCRNSGLTEEIHDALTGHAGKSAGRKYGAGFAIKTLAPAMEQIVWPKIDPEFVAVKMS